jgi:hypothetical protein
MVRYLRRFLTEYAWHIALEVANITRSNLHMRVFPQHASIGLFHDNSAKNEKTKH